MRIVGRHRNTTTAGCRSIKASSCLSTTFGTSYRPLQVGNGDGGTQARPDLIYVTATPRKGLVFRFIEVKYRRHLRAARTPEVLRKIHEQTESLHRRWYDWYSHAEVCSSFRAVRRAKLARVLRFYVDKAHRHHLPAPRHKALASEIDRMIERGGDYALQALPDGNRGWVFCPEYAGLEPLEISPAGWSTRIFLFGPGLLPDSDFRHATVTGPPEPSDTMRVGGSPVGQADDERVEGDSAFPHRAEDVTVQPTIPTPERSGRETEDTADTPPSVCLGTDTVTNAEVRWPLTTKGNPHLLIAGLPGMGKTTCLLNLCRQMVAADIRPIIFSYHQDIDERLEQSVDSVRFIDFDGLGFNPLQVVDRESRMGASRCRGRDTGYLHGGLPGARRHPGGPHSQGGQGQLHRSRVGRSRRCSLRSAGAAIQALHRDSA